MDSLNQTLQRYRAADAARHTLLEMGADVRMVGPFAYPPVHGPAIAPAYMSCPDCEDRGQACATCTL